MGDLVGFAPSRIAVWDYDGYYYPTYGRPSHSRNINTIGIIIEVYEKYGYYSDRYYKIKWSDNNSFSNEKHENLILISHGTHKDKE